MTYEEKMKIANELGAKIRTFVNSIRCPEKPELPNKVGYKWELSYTFGSDTFVWVSVPDPEAKGTEDNLFEWTFGMTTMVNAFYVYEDKIYTCIKAGNPTDITDRTYFEPMTI